MKGRGEWICDGEGEGEKKDRVIEGGNRKD